MSGGRKVQKIQKTEVKLDKQSNWCLEQRKRENHTIKKLEKLLDGSGVKLLNKWVASLGGNSAVVVTVTSDTDVSLLSPSGSP